MRNNNHNMRLTAAASSLDNLWTPRHHRAHDANIIDANVWPACRLLIIAVSATSSSHHIAPLMRIGASLR